MGLFFQPSLQALMKVLLTNLTLSTQTGTEMATRDLALGLLRAGHEACVFSPLLGAIAREIAGAGVPVVSRIEDVPYRPDIIHGHHHVETTLALTHFRNIPAIFVCHDRLSWHDIPPRLSGIRRYVAVDRNCLERLVIEAGIPEEQTRLILNAVDLRRFSPRQSLPARPARALVFSNYAKEGSELATLREVCREADVELAVTGAGVGFPALRPEEILGEYDLVFAKARCALEALAAGCAVILCDWQGLGPMVTSARLQELREWNLGMRCLQEPWGADSIRRELARYDPADAGRVTELVRTGASLDQAVANYVEVYEEALADFLGTCVTVSDAVETLARNIGAFEGMLRAADESSAAPPLPPTAAAQIEVRLCDAAIGFAAGESTEVTVEIDNRSAERLASLPPYPVCMAYHWLESGTGRCIVFEGERTLLSPPVRPRSRLRLCARVVAPKEPGQYVLVLTLVQEGRFWFDQIHPSGAALWEGWVCAGGLERPGIRSLSEVAAWTTAQLARDGEFMNLGFVSKPQEAMLTFVEAPRFAPAALNSPQTTCVLTKPEWIGMFPERLGLAVAEDPRSCFFEIHNRLTTTTDFYGPNFRSQIDKSARLHPRSWVDENNVVIHAGVTVGPNAAVLGRAVVGEATVIHAGAVIGAAGFQRSREKGNPIELVHAGAAEVRAGCHIFSNAVIARGLFRQSTRIGRGCRIGNCAFVSHNCVLGDEVFIGHGAVVNGNVSAGANAWIGPGATVTHGVTIGREAQVSLGATVIRNVRPGQRVTGSLAIEHQKMLRLMAAAEKARRR
jgi:UDP-3-O-[3-hydroxymyristoyl] glucosamine N-acyltransferase